MIIGDKTQEQSIIGDKREDRLTDSVIGNKNLNTQADVIGRPDEKPQEVEVDPQFQGLQQQDVILDQQDKPKEKETTFFDYASDLAMAPIRGVAGAFNSAYNLLDWMSGDRLWDWNSQTTLGRSKTILGGFAEGMMQFMVGFAPGLGVASKVGKAFQLSKLGKASGAVGKTLGRFAKGNRTLDVKTLKQISKLKGASKTAVRNASAGMFADALVWKTEEERLSNVLQNFDIGRDNAIVEWMSYDPNKDESELEARFKNAVEGLFFGSVIGTAFAAGKGAVKGTKNIYNTYYRAVPEKEKAVEGMSKVFSKFREKNKELAEQTARGEEPNELLAIQKAKDSNVLSDDEVKSILELNKRQADEARFVEFEDINNVKLNRIPPAKSWVDAAEQAKKNQRTVNIESVDPDTLTEEAIDKWFRKNTDISPSTMSLATKKEAIKDIIKEGGYDGVEAKIIALEDTVIQRLKQAGVYDETNVQSMLSGLRAVDDVPELRALITRTAKEVFKQQDKSVYSAKEAKNFYESTEKLIGLGIEGAGGRRETLDLSRLRNTPEDLKRVRVEGEVLYDALGVAGRQIAENLQNARETLSKKGKGYVTVDLKGKGRVTMNKEEAMMELENSIEIFSALQEVWADFGTQLSLGLRQRQQLYKTGSSSLGRDIVGADRQLGFAINKANTTAGKIWRRQKRRGYSDKRLIKDLEKVFKKTSLEDAVLGKDVGMYLKGLKELDSPVNAKISKLSLASNKGLAVSQEWYYNAILSNPTTWMVNLIGGALMLPLRHIESIAGGIATGNIDLVKANFRVMFDLQSFVDAAKYAWRSGVENDPRSISGFTAYRDDRLLNPKGEIRVDNPEGDVLKSAFNVIGTVVRSPTRIMMMGDEFFKQMSFRARTRTALAVEGYKRGYHKNPKGLATWINDGYETLITKDGRFRNEENIRKEAFLELSRLRKAGQAPTNSRQFIEDYVQTHYRSNSLKVDEGIYSNVLNAASREELVQSGTDWALVNTFTNEVTNPFFKTTGKVATMHPLLGFVIPFVRTPSNILLFALGRTVPYGAGKELLTGVNSKKLYKTFDDIKAELGDAADMPFARKQAEETLSIINTEKGIKQAEAAGRLAFGVMATGAMLMNVERIKERITGGEPKDPGQKEIWKNTGKQAYSIKFGDTWYSYQRLDPFATILGIMADAVHLYDDAMNAQKRSVYNIEEEYAEQDGQTRLLFGVIATTMANNVSNKSYIKNIGEFFEILEKPDQTLGNITANVVSGMAVPSIINWSQGAYEENPALLEAKSVMDKIRKRLPPSLRDLTGEPLMPKRNFLGEIKRKEIEGYDMFNPIFHRTASNDIVDLELEQHGVGRNVPSAMKTVLGKEYNLNNLRNDKGQTAYDRYLELMGTVKTGGAYLTLRQELRKIINSNAYQRLPDITEENRDKNHPRTKLISRAFSIYKAKALRQLEKEFDRFLR